MQFWLVQHWWLRPLIEKAIAVVLCKPLLLGQGLFVFCCREKDEKWSLTMGRKIALQESVHNFWIVYIGREEKTTALLESI